MLASGRFFVLLLGEKEELVPLFNRAVDVIGSLALAVLFSTIDEEISRKSPLTIKRDGGQRTRGGIALQMLRQHAFGPYIFANKASRNGTGEVGAVLRRQGAIYNRAEFEATCADEAESVPLLPHSQADPKPDSTGINDCYCSVESSSPIPETPQPNDLPSPNFPVRIPSPNISRLVSHDDVII